MTRRRSPRQSRVTRMRLKIQEHQAQVSTHKLLKLATSRLNGAKGFRADVLLQPSLFGKKDNRIRNTSLQSFMKHDASIPSGLHAVVVSVSWRVHAPRDWSAHDEESDAVGPSGRCSTRTKVLRTC